MATFKYTVECIYETNKGASIEYTNLNTDIELSRFYEEGAGSHILRRFLPMIIRKNKKNPLFSGMKTWLITDVKKIDDKFELEGKNILEMSEEELQKLACMYDLFEVPLPQTVSISAMRDKAAIAYLKNVIKIPMKTPKEKEATPFYIRQKDGSFKLDFNGEPVIVKVLGDYTGKKVEVKQKSLSDFYAEAEARENKIVEEKVIEQNLEIDNDKSSEENSNFPSLNDLVQ